MGKNRSDMYQLGPGVQKRPVKEGRFVAGWGWKEMPTAVIGTVNQSAVPGTHRSIPPARRMWRMGILAHPVVSGFLILQHCR